MKNSLQAYRSISDLPLHRLVKGTLGRMLSPLLPEYAESIRRSPFRHRLNRAGRLIRNSYFLKAVEAKDHEAIRDLLRDYWSSQMSDEFYTGLSHRYETLFLRYHAGIVGETAKAMAGRAGEFRRLVEIGSGDGKTLEHFCLALPSLETFHGVDVNSVQVENNRMVYARRPAMRFHQGDAGQWLKDHPEAGTVVVANGGVLEYFTRPELQSLFSFLAGSCPPCVISITESLATDHDLKNEAGTYPYGWELSLSHNYIALLEEAGFEIRYMKDRLTTPEESETVGRWLQVVALKG